ncbi:MAG: hypothetical protein HQ490_01875 [Lutibacter sp.]|nr:hypothetical protein [Lutibacter sp.]
MKFYKTDVSGNLVPEESQGQLNVVQALTADTTLTVADSGKIFLLDAIGEVISLPTDLVSGVNFKFRVVADVITTPWTIVSATDVIEGYASVAYATVIGANENTISLVHTKAIIGDEISVFCDGTSWHASGHGSVAASVTFTAPA